MSIKEHLQQSCSSSTGRAVAAASEEMLPNCKTHEGHSCNLYCATCSRLIYAMCAAFNHNGHKYSIIADVCGEYRDAIGAHVALTVASRDEVVAAKTELESACGQIRTNGKAAKDKLTLGFNRVMQEGRKRKEALVAQVDEAVRVKLGMLGMQVKSADDSDHHSTQGINLTEAMLKITTPTQVLQYQKLLINGLKQFQHHGLALKQCCGTSMDVELGDHFEQVVAQIGTLGTLRTMDTDPTASTAEGEGLASAQIGVVAKFVVTTTELVSGNARTTGGDRVVASMRVNGSVLGVADSTAAEGAAAAAGSGGGVTAATVVDNCDGTYSCSYTPSECGAAAAKIEIKGADVRQFDVFVNGKHIVGSPFTVAVRPGVVVTNWVFGSIQNDTKSGRYKLSEGGAVATTTTTPGGYGIIADGLGCTPMTSGVHCWELEVVKTPGNDHWHFGVCRPGNDRNRVFHDGWMVYQHNRENWELQCDTCKGTGMTLDPKPNMIEGSRIGLLLDLANGGTLTMCWDNKPCGTIAEGLVGPLLPCILPQYANKVVKIYGGLRPPYFWN